MVLGIVTLSNLRDLQGVAIGKFSVGAVKSVKTLRKSIQIDGKIEYNSKASASFGEIDIYRIDRVSRIDHDKHI